MFKLKDYNYLEEDEINKENLIKDDGFVSDAYDFLYKRNNNTNKIKYNINKQNYNRTFNNNQSNNTKPNKINIINRSNNSNNKVNINKTNTNRNNSNRSNKSNNRRPR